MRTSLFTLSIENQEFTQHQTPGSTTYERFPITKKLQKIASPKKKILFSAVSYLQISFITSPAIINPTTDGTKAILPGNCLFLLF